MRFPHAILDEPASARCAAPPPRRATELLAREHVVVRRKNEGTTREFDARPSIVTLDVGFEDGSTVLDCHLRFTPRAAIRPEELILELIPEADPRGADVERMALWSEASGRRWDPLELLTHGDVAAARLHGNSS